MTLIQDTSWRCVCDKHINIRWNQTPDLVSVTWQTIMRGCRILKRAIARIRARRIPIEKNILIPIALIIILEEHDAFRFELNEQRPRLLMLLYETSSCARITMSVIRITFVQAYIMIASNDELNAMRLLSESKQLCR